MLTVLWGVSLGLLLRAMGKTTTVSCSANNWGNDAGVRVCHLFKLLVAFCVFSILSFVAMLATAVVVRRRGGAAYGYSPAANPTKVGHKATATDTAYHPPSAYGAPPPAYNPPGSNAATAKP